MSVHSGNGSFYKRSPANSQRPEEYWPTIIEKPTNNWVFTLTEVLNSPSVQTGITREQEVVTYYKGIDIIIKAALDLKIPRSCIFFAVNYFYRFYQRCSMKKFYYKELAQACLYLSSKKLECHKGSKLFALEFARLMSPGVNIDETTKQYWDWRTNLEKNEQILLDMLCFDTTIKNPYEFFNEVLDDSDETHAILKKDIIAKIEALSACQIFLLFDLEKVFIAFMVVSAIKMNISFPSKYLEDYDINPTEVMEIKGAWEALTIGIPRFEHLKDFLTCEITAEDIQRISAGSDQEYSENTNPESSLKKYNYKDDVDDRKENSHRKNDTIEPERSINNNDQAVKTEVNQEPRIEIVSKENERQQNTEESIPKSQANENAGQSNHKELTDTSKNSDGLIQNNNVDKTNNNDNDNNNTKNNEEFGEVKQDKGKVEAEATTDVEQKDRTEVETEPIQTLETTETAKEEPPAILQGQNDIDKDLEMKDIENKNDQKDLEMKNAEEEKEIDKESSEIPSIIDEGNLKVKQKKKYESESVGEKRPENLEQSSIDQKVAIVKSPPSVPKSKASIFMNNRKRVHPKAKAHQPSASSKSSDPYTEINSTNLNKTRHESTEPVKAVTTSDYPEQSDNEEKPTRKRQALSKTETEGPRKKPNAPVNNPKSLAPDVSPTLQNTNEKNSKAPTDQPRVTRRSSGRGAQTFNVIAKKKRIDDLLGLIDSDLSDVELDGAK